MITQLSQDLPYYVSLPEGELTTYLEAAGIRDKDEITLFYRICRFAEANRTSNIDIDEFLLEVVRWAELNNMVKFRHLQNVRRIITELIPRLKEKWLVGVEIRNNEIVSLKLYEPETLRLSELYAEITKNVATPFPTAQDLPFALPNNFFYELKIEDFTQEGIAAARETGKTVKISFGGSEPEIYCPWQLLTDLPRIARLKIRTVLYPNNQRTKLLDDISRDLKTLMPDKVVSPERILQVLEGKEPESPMYFINLATRFISYMQLEREFKFKVTAVQAGKLLLNQKLDEEQQKKAELEKNQRKIDMERALEVFRKVEQLMTREEIISPENEKKIWSFLTNQYKGAALRMLLYEMLETYSQMPKTEEEGQPVELLPAIVKLKSRVHDYYIHREAMIPYLLAEQERIHNELSSFYTYNWSETLRYGGDDPAMKFDEFFVKDVEKKVSQRYPEFSLLMSVPRLVMNAVYYAPLRNEERNELLVAWFTRPSDPVFKPYHVILGLERHKLAKAARAKLPLSYRFFILRWFFALFRLFSVGSAAKKKNKEAPRDSSVGQDMGEQGLVERSLGREEFSKGLERLRLEYLGSATDVASELKRLENEWNIKIGPVRQVLTDKINDEVKRRVERIYSMMIKQPSFSVSYLNKELENMADDMVRRAGDDVRNKKAFKNYLLLVALETLGGRL